jgi:tRNA(Ile)-lysidine synthase
MPFDPLAAEVARYVAEHAVLADGEPVVALVSGGADSLCLWGVLRELAHPVEALHVAHRLRDGEGEADARFCAGLGATVVEAPVEPGANVEARARDARYAAARRHAAGRTLAVGHTLTDQAETVLYRLASSSGPRAVRAMQPRRDDVARPLLGVTAGDTRAWCDRHGLAPRHDATNDDVRLRRNLIRHRILPLLADVHAGAERNLARSAELLGELDDLVRELAGNHVADELDLDRLAALPRALRVLVLREAAERAAGRQLRLPRELTARLEMLASRRTGVERLSLGRDIEAVRRQDRLGFRPPEGYPPAR